MYFAFINLFAGKKTGTGHEGVKEESIPHEILNNCEILIQL